MWRLVIPNWFPPSLNTSRGRHWSKGAANTRAVADILAVYALKAGVPLVSDKYRPRRGLSLDVVKSGKLGDRDNLLKHFLDGAKAARLIVDDSQEWCLWAPPNLIRAVKGERGQGTVVVVWDLPAVQPEQFGGAPGL